MGEALNEAESLSDQYKKTAAKGKISFAFSKTGKPKRGLAIARSITFPPARVALLSEIAIELDVLNHLSKAQEILLEAEKADFFGAVRTNSLREFDISPIHIYSMMAVEKILKGRSFEAIAELIKNISMCAETSPSSAAHTLTFHAEKLAVAHKHKEANKLYALSLNCCRGEDIPTIESLGHYAIHKILLGRKDEGINLITTHKDSTFYQKAMSLIKIEPAIKIKYGASESCRVLDLAKTLILQEIDPAKRAPALFKLAAAEKKQGLLKAALQTFAAAYADYPEELGLKEDILMLQLDINLTLGQTDDVMRIITEKMQGFPQLRALLKIATFLKGQENKNPAAQSLASIGAEASSA